MLNRPDVKALIDINEQSETVQKTIQSLDS